MPGVAAEFIKMNTWRGTRLARIVFIVLLAAIPLYLKFPLAAVAGTYVAIRVTDIVVVLALLLFALEMIWRRDLSFLKQPVTRLFIFFWLAGLLANMSALFLTDFIVSRNLLWFHWLRRIEYMSVFFIAWAALASVKEIKIYLRFLLLILATVFFYGLGQKYLAFPVVSTMNAEFSQGALLYLDKWVRISSTFAGHYDLAAWLVLILPIIIAFSLWEKNLFWRITGLIIFAGGFQLLAWTASRISFIAYLLAISLTLLLLRRWWLWLLVIMLSLGWGFQSRELSARLSPQIKPLIALLPSRLRSGNFYLNRSWPFQPPSRKVEQITPAPSRHQETLPKAQVGKSAPIAGQSAEHRRIFHEAIRTWPKPEEVQAAARRSSTIRFQVEWPRALRAWAKNPLFGLGYTSLGLATDCDYLRALGETGILGALAFLLLLWHLGNTFLRGWEEKRSNGEYYLLLAGFLGGLVGFLANAVFIDVFEASKDAFYFWMLMGLGYKLAQLAVGSKLIRRKGNK